MTPHDEQLAKIFSEAEGLGYLDPKYAEVMHEQVLSLYIDMMLELAAAQHEIETLKAQREATRIYLGVALSSSEDKDGNTSPEEILRNEVKRIIEEHGLDRKIQCIKELRGSGVAAQAWDDFGNSPSGGYHLGLKEAKDIIDYASRGFLYTGAHREIVKL